MHGMLSGLALAVMMAVGDRWVLPMLPHLDPSIWVRGDESVAMPSEAWLRSDPADSVYRTARESLNRRDYRTAANLFAQIPARFPKSAYAPDALYWQAFALYRLGGDRDLHEALAALGRQQAQFPKAATKGDAKALERRIQGELAKRGDSEAAAQVAEAARTAGMTPPVPPVPPVPPTPPTPPTPPEPPSGASSRARARSASSSSSGGCEGSEDDMKVAALNALQQMDAARARPILQKVLARRDAASVCLRRKAVFLVAQQQANGTESILLESVRSDPDPEVQRQAVFWLSQVNTDRAVEALDSILRFSKDPEVQDKAVFALSQQSRPAAQKALRTYAERGDVPEDAREKAIFWLGQSGSPDNATFLRSLYGRLKNEDLRKKIVFSLSQMGGTENGKWLLGIARDPAESIEMRKQALFWAGQGGVPIAELTALYASVSDQAMREQLVFVYSQRDEPAALDKLIDIAKKDPNPELRKRALFWVGQSEDDRAVQALQDILEQP
ncbi:MAG TPA: HEAT repeat domain-containing protein [Gemmatimonadales bacterium]|nr:HEAT repeat domain-containing protein [Gemmatimonadales bacterium]